MSTFTEALEGLEQPQEPIEDLALENLLVINETDDNPSMSPGIKFIVVKNDKLKKQFDTLRNLYLVDKVLKQTTHTDFSIANEVFTMLPLYEEKVKGKLTSTPSKINHELISDIVETELKNFDISEIKTLVDEILEYISNNHKEMLRSYKEFIVVSMFIIQKVEELQAKPQTLIAKTPEGSPVIVSIIETPFENFSYYVYGEDDELIKSIVKSVDFSKFNDLAEICPDNTLTDIKIKLEMLVTIYSKYDQAVSSFISSIHAIDDFSTIDLEKANEIMEFINTTIKAITAFKKLHEFMTSPDCPLFGIEKFLKTI